MTQKRITAEHERLRAGREYKAHWRRFGPYVSERQWGTVREDYSADGSAWTSFPFEHARSRAYRWGEDGLLGISDNHQRLCLSLCFWNGRDKILKERAYGVSGKEGNHGEDLKEYYFFLDNLPSHAYMRALYKYPQNAFPYDDLLAESLKRTRLDPEYELIDTGIFDNDEYFDIFVTYAKAGTDDVVLELEIFNRAAVAADLEVLPTLVFRNTWSWTEDAEKPCFTLEDAPAGPRVRAAHPTLGTHMIYAGAASDVLFTENETNHERINGTPSAGPYVKDAFHSYIIDGKKDAVNPAQTGTKAAFRYKLSFAPGERKTLRLRLSDQTDLRDPLGDECTKLLKLRAAEADEFYETVNPFPISDESRAVQRQALAGLLWSKQFYHFVVRDWLEGDPTQPKPPPERKAGRNSDWRHLYNDDILSMPDTWEYPWFASWDLAFQAIPLAMVDPDFAKAQLMVLLREWYMHPNGSIPAYEWEFSDTNPPVHAWAALRVYRIDRKMSGVADILFLERVFQKLLMNFTWWVNREDAGGRNVFQGGFLGLDNIGVFNRSEHLPGGGSIDQSDGTSWMAFYCLNMLAIAMELAQHNRSYEDIASKFFEHFLYIAEAMNGTTSKMRGLWDDDGEQYLDILTMPDGRQIPLKIHSMVGLIPLLAVETIEPHVLDRLPRFAERMNWFIENRPDLAENVASMEIEGLGERRLLAIANQTRLCEILRTMLAEDEFLSPHGVRSISKYHKNNPYLLSLDGEDYRVDYEPAESSSPLFGGNSNWRGPVWFPINYLLIEALQKFHHYYGDDLRVECPTGSGIERTLWDIGTEISHRLIDIFRRNDDDRRPVYGETERFQTDPHWHDYILFYEHFHGDNGAGLGASHQTGWTALVAKLIQQCAEYCGQEKSPMRVRKPPAPADFDIRNRYN